VPGQALLLELVCLDATLNRAGVQLAVFGEVSVARCCHVGMVEVVSKDLSRAYDFLANFALVTSLNWPPFWSPCCCVFGLGDKVAVVHRATAVLPLAQLVNQGTESGEIIAPLYFYGELL
jgi:hypothetical protein